MFTFSHKIIKLVLCFSLCILISACGGYYGDDEIQTSYLVSNNWQTAKRLQAEGRFEASREYFLLALASAQTLEEQVWLERELAVVDLQIQAKR